MLSARPSRAASRARCAASRASLAVRAALNRFSEGCISKSMALNGISPSGYTCRLRTSKRSTISRDKSCFTRISSEYCLSTSRPYWDPFWFTSSRKLSALGSVIGVSAPRKLSRKSFKLLIFSSYLFNRSLATQAFQRVKDHCCF